MYALYTARNDTDGKYTPQEQELYKQTLAYDSFVPYLNDRLRPLHPERAVLTRDDAKGLYRDYINRHFPLEKVDTKHFVETILQTWRPPAPKPPVVSLTRDPKAQQSLRLPTMDHVAETPTFDLTH